jgi:hypothetical protein
VIACSPKRPDPKRPLTVERQQKNSARASKYFSAPLTPDLAGAVVGQGLNAYLYFNELYRKSDLKDS